MLWGSGAHLLPSTLPPSTLSPSTHLLPSPPPFNPHLPPLPLQEIHDALSSIEGEAERICSLERNLLDADALERDRLYARAEAISSALLTVGGWRDLATETRA